MKHICSAVLIFVVLSILFAGCCSAQSPAATALLNQWTLLMDANETWFAAMEWTLDHADAFYQDRSWDNLVRARIACSDSYSELLYMTMPEAILTEEDYLNLFREGIEFSEVDAEIEQMETSKYVDILFLESMQANLFEGIFTGTDAVITQQRIEARRSSLRCMQDYYRYATYYLLLEIGDEALTEAYWADMQDSCPHIYFSRDVFELHDLESVELRINEILDEYEDTMLLYNQSMGMMEYSIEQILQAEDVQLFTGDACAIENTPLMLPYPAWLDCSEALIFHLDYSIESGEFIYPPAMTELEAPTNSIVYSMKGVDEAELTAYIEDLADYGVCFDLSEGSSSINQVIAMEGGGYAMLTYEQGDVRLYFLDCDVLLAPEWYIQTIR